MQIKVFSIPAFGDARAEDELNAFLRGQRVLDVTQELVSDGSGAYWAFCVRYLEYGAGEGRKGRGARKERIDYKEVLSEDAFRIFAALRNRRKQLAAEEGIPAFAILTDSELAELAKAGVENPLTEARMKSVEGIGEKKLERYGKQLLEALNDTGPEENTQ